MLLKVDKLVKIYNKKRVVNGVSFQIAPGEIVGLLGRNGAGKTTTFKMSIGLIIPNDGKVFLEDKDITRMPMFRRARLGMGYLSQEPSVFRGLTVRNNLIAVIELLKPERRPVGNIQEQNAYADHARPWKILSTAPLMVFSLLRPYPLPPFFCVFFILIRFSS